MSRFPETDADMRKAIKEKGEHHHQIALKDGDLVAHMLVLPKDLRNQIGSLASQTSSGDFVRSYICCENYSPFSVEALTFQSRVSDPVATLSGPQVSGSFTVPTVEQDQESGINWRFASLEAVIADARAEVLCHWLPQKAKHGRGGETVVKITTTL